MKLILNNGASLIISDEALIIKYYDEIVGEQWKPIADYEDYYEVSSHGNVRNIKTGRILKPRDNGRGYLQVSLCKKGHAKDYRIHRLVAEAFIPNPENKATVNHISKDKTDNRVCNLEWMTNKENVRYSNCKKVLCIEIGKVYDSVREAERETGVKSISACCNGRQNTAGGFHWCFC